MKKHVLAVAMLAIFGMTAAVSAQQKATDFSGTWLLDTAKSKLQRPVDSMVMTVVQDEKQITITTETKRPEPTADARGGRRGGGGGMMGSGDGTSVYTLDGKEKTVQQDGPMGPMPVGYKAKVDGTKLNLTQSRTFNSPMGDISVSVKEKWEIGTDGTLTVTREMNSPQGSTSSTMVFAKKVN